MLDASLNLGYNVDLWDDGMLATRGKVEGGKLVFGDVKYPVVILNGPQNMPLGTPRSSKNSPRAAAFWSGAPPPSVTCMFRVTRPPRPTSRKSWAIFGRLFGPGGPGIVAPTEADFAELVEPKLCARLCGYAGQHLDLLAVHRHGDGGEIYLLPTPAPRTSGPRDLPPDRHAGAMESAQRQDPPAGRGGQDGQFDRNWWPWISTPTARQW